MLRAVLDSWENRALYHLFLLLTISFFPQEKIRSNYDAIKFRPEHFIDYLLSDSVGFATFEVLETPQHKATGN